VEFCGEVFNLMDDRCTPKQKVRFADHVEPLSEHRWAGIEKKRKLLDRCSWIVTRRRSKSICGPEEWMSTGGARQICNVKIENGRTDRASSSGLQ